MPRNRAGLIIATYEGVQVDWPVMIADRLRRGHRLGKKEEWQENIDSGGAMAHTVSTTSGAHHGVEAGEINRRNPQNGFKTAANIGG